MRKAGRWSRCLPAFRFTHRGIHNCGHLPYDPGHRPVVRFEAFDHQLALIEDVITGCVIQVGEQAGNIANEFSGEIDQSSQRAVRLSVGLEDAVDLISDLDQALESEK